MENRIKELDGLRGIAIILVMSLHLFGWAVHFTENTVLKFITNLTTIGWAGVDIFFTLSGFLITSILLHSKNNEYYFKNFYARRILRIFPLYYLTIAIVILFVPNLEPEFIKNLKFSLPIMLLYGQNWLLLYDPDLLTNYLGVTWSLAIEEQFYLIWPPIIQLFSRERLIKYIFGYIILLSLIQTITIFFFENVSRITFFYYLSSFTRFEEMLIGGLLAIWLTYDNALETLRRFSLPIFISGMLLFVIICLLSLPNSLEPVNNIWITLGGYKLLGVLTVGLIGIFITYPAENYIRRFFQNPLLIFFGNYSYSMYLFHEIFGLILYSFFLKNNFHGTIFFFIFLLLVSIIIILVSLLTWHLFEKHMLNLKKYFESKEIL